MMKNGEKSLNKVFDIIEAAGRYRDGVTAKRLAEELGMPESTLFRMVKFLIERGYLRRNGAMLTLGAAALRLGGLAQRQNPPAQVAHGALAALSEQTCETVHLAELQGDHIIYVDKVEGSRSVRMASLIGSSGPLYCTGVGKVILAFQPEVLRKHLLESMRFEAFTPATITSAERLNRELEKIRQEGFAVDDCEHEHGVYCVAAPVFNASGEAFAGISVSGSELYLRDRASELAREVVAAARAISARLGGDDAGKKRCCNLD